MKTNLITGIALFMAFICRADFDNDEKFKGGLVAWLPFSGNAVDMTSNNHNGIILGATLCPDRFGQANSAYALDGQSVIVISNTTGMFPSPEFSLSVWIKTPTATRVLPEVLVSTTKAGDSSSGWFLALSSAGGLYFQSAPVFEGDPSCDPPDGFWYHAVVTYNGSIRKVYLNASLEAADPVSYYALASPYPLVLGAQLYPDEVDPNLMKYFFTGCLDDLRIYNREIAEGEVKALFKVKPQSKGIK